SRDDVEMCVELSKLVEALSDDAYAPTLGDTRCRLVHLDTVYPICVRQRREQPARVAADVQYVFIGPAIYDVRPDQIEVLSVAVYIPDVAGAAHVEGLVVGEQRMAKRQVT